MNSEELEQSLRTEFESYLKDTIAEVKQDVSEFQQKIESEFEQHKSRIDESVKEFSEKFGDDKKLEESFQDSISEHLKLAREDGSKITAAAFEEAEKLREEQAAESEAAETDFDFGDIRDAINEISGKDSQSEILKSLVHHATQYTPRGAFFIVKNEHLVGWRMFGTEEHSNPQVVREVFFPVSSKTALSESIETLATVEGSSDENEDGLLYLNKLDFETPENMYALPLVARGRGVAVLYADNGTEGGKVNVEALETLMRVAGLTVEVLASTQIAKNQASERSADANISGQQDLQEEESHEPESSFSSTPTAFVETEPPATDFKEVKETPTNEFEQVEYSSDIDSTATAESEVSDSPSSDFDFQPVAESEETSTDEMSFETVDSTEEKPEETFSYEDTSPEPLVEETTQDLSEPESIENDFTPSAETVEDDFTTSIEEEDYSVAFDSDISDTSDIEDEDSAATEEDYSVAFDSADSAESLSFDSNEADTTSTAEEFQANTEFEAPQFETFTETTTNDSVESTDDSVGETEYEFETNETTNDFSFSDENVQTDDFDQETESTTEKEVEETVTTTAAAPPPPVRTRFGDRNVDLPIEVAEDERRLHNDARRFARLLVSEIKLYNEQKVKEGRESSDLYERLREAIDRSREMYDKRVQPPVAAKFDYFNYELINTLAEGEETKLGGSYPGANV